MAATAPQEYCIHRDSQHTFPLSITMLMLLTCRSDAAMTLDGEMMHLSTRRHASCQPASSNPTCLLRDTVQRQRYDNSAPISAWIPFRRAFTRFETGRAVSDDYSPDTRRQTGLSVVRLPSIFRTLATLELVASVGIPHFAPSFHPVHLSQVPSRILSQIHRDSSITAFEGTRRRWRHRSSTA